MISSNNRRIGKLMILFGVLLVLGAAALSVYNIADESRAEKAAVKSLAQLEEVIPAEPIDAGFEQPLYELNRDIEMPLKTVDGVDYIGTIEIPALSVKLPVISEWSNSALKTAPCRYSGSAYKNDLVIAAHNYRRFFANLNKLEIGSEIIFTDIDANEFKYSVVATEILQPTDVEEMVSGEWDLTLFTCTYGGRTRLTVRCMLEK